MLSPMQLDALTRANDQLVAIAFHAQEHHGVACVANALTVWASQFVAMLVGTNVITTADELNAVCRADEFDLPIATDDDLNAMREAWNALGDSPNVPLDVASFLAQLSQLPETNDRDVRPDA